MHSKLCIMFGAIAGGAVGVIVGLLGDAVCCTTPPPPPTLLQLSADGLLVALIAVLIAAAFTCLINRLPIKPVFLLALLIGILVGILLSHVAYHIHNPGVALIACSVIGALLGWLICRILCTSRLTALGAPQ